MRQAGEVTEFDLCGPLPQGVTVLEASAGTGKTYTIAALTVRYVAEGMPLESMLLITFTRMATGELRDRVRERLVHYEQRLTRVLAGEAPGGEDALLALLSEGGEVEVRLRRERLARAVSGFDAATIATTHSFCQDVLAELGTVGDLEPGTEFVESVSDLLEQVLDDVYLRRFALRDTPKFDRKQALQIARKAVAHAMADLEPEGESYDSTAAMRHRLAVRVREELSLRKRQLAIMTYDDLLTRLRDTLDGPNGDTARQRLRNRFRLVMVDEFQDTDPIQWQILHRAFAHDEVTLVLIADPKQAIYAFRGADVYAYLTAAATAATEQTLPVNHRSDQPLLDAFDALFANTRLGHERILYRSVRSAPENADGGLDGAPDPVPLRIRVLHRDEPGVVTTGKQGTVTAPSGRDNITADLVAQVVALLDSGATVRRRGPGEPARSAVGPGDLAVLVRSNYQAGLISDELHEAGVPAVINGAGSVFATPAARDWLRLLEALERPSSTVAARTAALTPFLGWSAERVATEPEEAWEDVHRRLHGWSRILRDRGVAALEEAVSLGEQLPARMLSRRGGERRLTDLRHVAQLLHRTATEERLGVTALRGWLAERLAETGEEDRQEERARRLESDAEAVQVLTIHRSKGLEYPIVFCPFLWDYHKRSELEPVLYHDPARGERCMLDVGLEHDSFEAHKRRSLEEERGEDLRLLYVALTRARHQVVVWWAGSSHGCNSPLTRLLFGRDPDGNVATQIPGAPSDEAAMARFQALAADAPGRISVARSTLGLAPYWSPPADQPPELDTAAFRRALDLRWRRTSYSDITSAAHDAVAASEPEHGMLSDEPTAPVPVPVPTLDGVGPGEGDPRLEELSPLADAPGGTDFGTFVHAVLEAADFAAPDLDAELAACAAASSRRLRELDPALVLPGLRAAIETPLGPVLGGIRLRDVARADRLDELEFELPLAGGDEPTGRVTLAALAEVLRRRLPSDDPLAGYAERLEDPLLRASVRGFLTGSIDSVLRLPGPSFAILDYKTNWLGPFDEPLTLGHYHPRVLRAEMARAHYGLQALLYTVALHRYLRWRVPGYDPGQHLAGVLYLFLRGMAGPTTPVVDGSPCGVFAWQPSGELVQAISDTLDGVGA